MLTKDKLKKSLRNLPDSFTIDELIEQLILIEKENRIKTIQASLFIEGNLLTEDQVTDLLDQKRVIGPQKDITEVVNAIQVYDQLLKFKPISISDFLRAHKMMMNGLLDDAGKYRSKNIGIAKGNRVAHVAPSPRMVPGLMKSLFQYLQNKTELSLIKSCVFHYELEFIHPFSDGNGRMGRLWQTDFGSWQYAGLILFFTGFFMLAECITRFAVEGRGTLSPADPTKRLVIRGLYNYSRNPMYVGVLLMLIGEAVFFEAGKFWYYVVGIALAFNIFILLVEEPRLKKDFGEEYAQYCRKVRRWF